MSDIVYTCSVCGRQTSVPKGQPVPLCCKKEMEALPFCTTAPTAEMARSADRGEPCDDGNLPKKGE